MENIKTEGPFSGTVFVPIFIRISVFNMYVLLCHVTQK